MGELPRISAFSTINECLWAAFGLNQSRYLLTSAADQGNVNKKRYWLKQSTAHKNSHTILLTININIRQYDDNIT